MSRWPRLMDRATLAEYLTLSTDKVDDLRREGAIGYVEPTRLKRFDKTVIDKWLDGLSGVGNPTGKSRFGERLDDGRAA